ncbi:ArsR family transcriptional regulator [Bacterioplanes sanyensis]|uniref:ArsR family transcriptional regulator n=1 Tax=Bacterioplanes sanyensis TaxID=1249553 RepID=A0A222FHF6_9GAMM|nr:metalloregulator ArsR/SmtB family transcription factor [Bacterioplanes sanyensis]ASP38190.1 ArsR family transcriptional regulator [Bacterioplanes sanyensis]
METPTGAHLDHQRLAQAHKAAGDALRLSILQLLGRGSFGVLELSQVFDVKQSGMSHHLKVLAQAGLVSTQREGTSIFYRRPLISGNDAWSQWLRTTFSAIDASDGLQDSGLQHNLSRVLNERTRACAEFFARNADAFKEQQDLIASYDQYGQALESWLAGYQGQSRYALEVGPGEGAFLPALAQRFQQVTALDISAPMLAQANAMVNQHQLSNVRCELGDTQWLLQQEHPAVDFAVANMVLHHVPAPQNIFADVYQLLAPGGALLITDLCRHDQSWAKQSCGDLWLGFEPDDLTDWAHSAGLTAGDSQFLGLRNGFQIQFRLFYRPARGAESPLERTL